MSPFLDTSALVKLYVAERGSDRVRGLAAGPAFAVSALSYVETRSSLHRRYRLGDLDDDALSVALGLFHAHWPSLSVQPLVDRVCRRAGDLCGTRELRTGDAIQLASALIFREEGLDVTFVSADRTLLRAAEAEGLTVLDPEA